jgi:hypothetical protein
MIHDLVIRNGLILEHSGAPAGRGRVRRGGR